MAGNNLLVKRNDDPNVRRSDIRNLTSPFEGLKNPVKENEAICPYSLYDLLTDRMISNILLSSNIFIFGKVGFLDFIIEVYGS